ncbi:Phage protein [Phage NCTB]|nr:Phage protein [Phage NCTB]
MSNENSAANGLESLSAGMNIQEVLAPVKLEGNKAADYENTFFPKRSKNKAGLKAVDFSIMVGSLVNYSAQLNNMYRILNHLLTSGGRYEDILESDADEFKNRVMSRVELIKQAASGEELVDELTRSFLGAMSSGQYHTIQDSKRFKGGKDIMFTGVPAYSGDGSSTSAGLAFGLASYEEPIMAAAGIGYDNAYTRHYASSVAQDAMSVMEEIQKLIFGSALSVETCTDWRQVQLPFDFDFTSLDQVFARKFGFNPGIFANEQVHSSLHPNFSILVMVPPNKNAVAAMSSYYNKLKYKDQNPEDVTELTEPDLTQHVSKESAVMQKFHVSLAMNLPREYVDYISQTTDGTLNLYALTNWIDQWGKVYLRPKGSRISNANLKGRAAFQRLPRYIIPASKNSILLKHRDDNNLPKDPGRVNQDRIGVSPRGLLTFMPRTEDTGFNNAEAYERDLDAALEASYRAGAPLTDTATLISRAFVVSKKDYRVESAVIARKKQLERYKGALLAFNWDYNVALSAGVSSAFSQIATDLNGSTEPSALAIADYLGYDFAQEQERDQKKNFTQSLNYMMPGADFSDMDPKKDAYVGYPVNNRLPFLFNDRFKKLLRTYVFLLRKNKVKGLEELIKQAASELNITNLSESKLDNALYSAWLSSDVKLKNSTEGNEVEIIFSCLHDAMKDAMGSPGGNLFDVVFEEVGAENVHTEIKEHGAYFNSFSSTMAEFGNVYNYLGGLLFKLVCEQITLADPRDLFQPLEEFDATLGGYMMPYNDVTHVIMPMAYMFSKYVPNAINIFEQAEQESESYSMDESIDVSDIQMPGIASGSKVFPHQIKAHKYLRNKPKFAVLDIHPGGGKTITLLLDIGAMVRESSEPMRYLVICPDKLVANWCEDLAKITKGSWNAIPITKDSFDTWGEEKLEELIQNAPPNTISFVGINFLKSKEEDISYGPRKLKLYGGCEFIKRQKYQYVALDESHKAKKFDPAKGKISIVHATIKQVFTAPHVKYSRLATGTLIHGLLEDVVGQSALFSAHTFRTPNDFAFDASAADGAIRVRSKFGQNAAVITVKRKEWAFMLPTPIDAFVPIKLLDPDDPDPNDEIFMQVYNALLMSTIQELEEKIKAYKGTQGEDQEDEGDDEDGNTEELDFDDDDELSAINPQLFKSYMQKLEQLIVDPWGDDAFIVAAKEAGVPPTFVSAKVRAVEKRLDRHFQVFDYDPNATSGARVVRWQQGMIPRELDVVEHKGLRYMRRRLETEEVSLKRRECPPSNIPPDEDLEHWKEEMHGKVLIFCRYTRSVDAIYKSLPPKYKSVARRFHGQVAEKWENVEAFKTDPDVKILIANEQAITEGHNLQMASRIIRVETPWSPGDYEQSTARIFRPDPAAAKIENGKPGDMRREVIYIDWLMAEGSLEVAKVARLMWKTVEKTKFDEKGNPRYEDIMGITLPKISMDVKTLISAATEGFDSFVDHFAAKAELNAIEGQEFHEMRKTTLAAMQDLPMVDALPDFKRLTNVPILPNQNIPDPDGFGLTRFLDWYGEWTDKNYDGNLEQLEGLTEEQLTKVLRGLPVRSEFGTGVIVGFTVNYVTREDGTKYIDPKMPVSNVRMRYSGNDEIGRVHPRRLFVAAKVTQEDFKKFFSTDKPWATESERKRIEADQAKKDKELAKKKAAEQRRRKRVEKNLEEEKSVSRKAKIRRENIRKNKPVNDGVNKVVKKLDPIKSGKDVKIQDGVEVRDMAISVIPSIYNGFLALHVNANDPDSKTLKNLGFQEFGEFAYCEFIRYPLFDKALDYIDDKMKLDRASTKRLEAVLDVFEDANRMNFNMKQATKVQSELPNFFYTRHRESRDRKTIKIYPVVMPDRLRITVDMRTNPMMKKHLNQTIPGAGRGGKWKLHEGMSIFFAVTKTEAKAKLRELLKAGYTIKNMDKVLEAIQQLKLVRSREHSAELKNMTGKK